MEKTELESIRKAGKIVVEVKKYAREIVKKDMLLLDIAEKIEDKIISLGGVPAFPTNLSINEIAAHYTPSYDDETKAYGLLKVDFGVQIKGYTADTAFSIDLEKSEENKKLIKASEEALEKAIEAAKSGKTLGDIGKAIQETAEKHDCSAIKNLSGHQIEQYSLHAGLTIPNYDNKSEIKLDDGIYAIEPFMTNGVGMVQDGKPSEIYGLTGNASLRDNNAREVFAYIIETYQTLPFCSRWLVKKFGTRALLSLRLIEQTGALHHFGQLIEKSKAVVAQSENTIIIHDGKVEVVTE
ncbi:MAG: type II methionyl aminopeptidase [Candidatus Pacearchaeota archaeon]|jgi:methionyl aminopeptidase